jgi:hypothetical protein
VRLARVVAGVKQLVSQELDPPGPRCDNGGALLLIAAAGAQRRAARPQRRALGIGREALLRLLEGAAVRRRGIIFGVDRRCLGRRGLGVAAVVREAKGLEGGVQAALQFRQPPRAPQL